MADPAGIAAGNGDRVASPIGQDTQRDVGIAAAEPSLTYCWTSKRQEVRSPVLHAGTWRRSTLHNQPLRSIGKFTGKDLPP